MHALRRKHDKKFATYRELNIVIRGLALFDVTALVTVVRSAVLGVDVARHGKHLAGIRANSADGSGGGKASELLVYTRKNVASCRLFLCC